MLPKAGQNATHDLYNNALLCSYIFVCMDLSILGVKHFSGIIFKNKNVFSMNFKICFTRIQNGRRKQVLMIIKVQKITNAGENINFEKYVDMGIA